MTEDTLFSRIAQRELPARSEGIADDGYRLLVNCGEHANQEVLHLHMHLVGGVQLGRMLSHQAHNPT